MLDFIQRFIELMNTGGVVMWVLFVLNFFLWYGLGYRYFILKRGTKGNVRRLIEKHEKRGEAQEMRGLLDYAVADALNAAKEAKAIGANMRKHIHGELLPYYADTSTYSTLVKTIIVLAPLIGLLGTVIGMIETFDALQNSSMFSQGASISGGISKALFTTELGLIVAVPGLIVGRVLDKKAQRYELELEQMTDIICTKDSHEI
ncbi:MAG: MotA/TolQ/ExbB proton channel family protein [Campylobacterota bacterium]|nr:MotA/TolQ/ExbB proton channel family protein [Campylobacterota bacterium]